MAAGDGIGPSGAGQPAPGTPGPWTAPPGQRPEEETLTHLQALLAHTQFHFHYEEGILAEKGYPEVEQHTLIHKELLNKAGRLAEAAARGEAGPTAYISFILDDVILGHLLRKDSQFFPYMEEPEANE